MKRHIPHTVANDRGNSRNVDSGPPFNRHRDIDRGLAPMVFNDEEIPTAGSSMKNPRN